MPPMSEPGNGWATPSTPHVPTPPPYGALPTMTPYSAGPRPGVVPLRPLTLGELLDGVVGLIRRYPRPVLGLSAALSVLVTVLNVVLAITVFRPLLSFDSSLFTGVSANNPQIDSALGGAAVGSVASSIVSALATLVLTGVMTVVAGRGVLGEPMTLRVAWDQVRPALPRLLGVALLTGLIVYGTLALGLVGAVALASLGGGGAALGVLLGCAGAALAIHLYVRLALAPCAAVLEHAAVRTSLRRSGVLVRRSWWRVFGILLLALVVSLLVGQVIQVPFLLFGLPSGGLTSGNLADSSSRLLVLTYIGSGIGQTVIAPFTSGVRALLYVDRRMRAEGLDVALLAAAASRST
jgi:hypothetical protein